MAAALRTWAATAQELLALLDVVHRQLQAFRFHCVAKALRTWISMTQDQLVARGIFRRVLDRATANAFRTWAHETQMTAKERKARLRVTLCALQAFRRRDSSRALRAWVAMSDKRLAVLSLARRVLNHEAAVALRTWAHATQEELTMLDTARSVLDRHVTSTDVSNLTIPAVTRLTSPRLDSTDHFPSSLTTPHLVSSRVASHHIASLHLSSIIALHHITSHHLSSRLASSPFS